MCNGFDQKNIDKKCKLELWHCTLLTPSTKLSKKGRRIRISVRKERKHMIYPTEERKVELGLGFGE